MASAKDWEFDDRDLIEVATLPFSELIRRAEDHDVAAINHLYSAYTRLILHRKAKKVCSHLSHMGGPCLEVETTFSHAYESSLQYGIEKVFGMTPDNQQENIGVAERGQFDARDLEHFQETRSSALRQIAKQTLNVAPQNDHDLISLWGRQVNSVVKRGFVDESRRRWNSDRRLAQRIDQRSYFIKQSGLSSRPSELTHTDLFKKFVEHLDHHIQRLQDAEGHQAQQVLEVYSKLNADLKTPDGLLLFLRVVYFDACENTYAHNYPVDEARLRRSFVRYEILDQHHVTKIELGALTSLVVLVEECLRLSYAKPEIEQQAILFNLQRARDATRIFDSLDGFTTDDALMAQLFDDADLFALIDDIDSGADM